MARALNDRCCRSPSFGPQAGTVVRVASSSGGVAMGRALACAIRGRSCSASRCPTSTPNLRNQVRGDLKRLHREVPVTSIYVTHDQVEAMTLGDRLCVMSAGEVQQIGTTDDIYNRPADTFVAAFWKPADEPDRPKIRHGARASVPPVRPMSSRPPRDRRRASRAPAGDCTTRVWTAWCPPASTSSSRSAATVRSHAVVDTGTGGGPRHRASPADTEFASGQDRPRDAARRTFTSSTPRLERLSVFRDDRAPRHWRFSPRRGGWISVLV